MKTSGRFLLIALFYSTLTLQVYSQGWFNIMGDSEYERFDDVIEKADLTYLACGSVVSSDGYMALVNYNLNGDTIWTKLFGDPDTDPRGYSLDRLEDGNYVLAGDYRTGDSNNIYDMAVYKVTPEGEELWFMGYPGTNAIDIKGTIDGGYIIAGDSIQGFPDYHNQISILKADFNGDVQWNTLIPLEDADTHPEEVLIDSEGNYVVVGDTYSFPEMDVQIIVCKISQDGELIWMNLYGGEEPDGGSSITETPTGYAITGDAKSFSNGNKDAYTLLIDFEGNELGIETYSSYNDVGYSIITTSDNSLVIGGWNRQSGTTIVQLIKTDIEGNLIWTQFYPFEGEGNCNSVIETSDGGFLLCGSLDIGDDYQFLAIKTNADGEIVSTSITEIEVSNLDKEVVMIYNFMGEEVKNIMPNQPYIYRYSDGSTKVIVKQ